MTFAYVTHIVWILRTKYEDLCGCSVCCTLEAVKYGFYMRSTKIFAFYKRIRPKRTKIWWGTDIEKFLR